MCLGVRPGVLGVRPGVLGVRPGVLGCVLVFWVTDTAFLGVMRVFWVCVKLHYVIF